MVVYNQSPHVYHYEDWRPVIRIPNSPRRPAAEGYTPAGRNQRFPVNPHQNQRFVNHSADSSVSSNNSKPLPSIPLRPEWLENKGPFGGFVSVDEAKDSSEDPRSRGGDPDSEITPRSLGGLLAAWWLELLSIFTMLVSLFAIAFTLRLHQGQPLPDWPYDISINALLSVYYTVFKGAMLLVVSEVLSQLKWTWFREPRPLWDLERFNDAARGPKGAIQLLWASKKHPVAGSLPILGALLVLLALLIDPFTQQIVTYYSCPRISPDLKASIPRTNNFSSQSWTMGSYGDGGTQNVTLDLGIQGAAYSGLFDASPVGEGYVPTICPSGNCTFDPYWSLGMCSSCVDLTDELKYDCKPYDWWDALSPEEYSTLAPLCNYTLSSSDGDVYLSMHSDPLNLTWTQLNATIGGGSVRVDQPNIAGVTIASWLAPLLGPKFSDKSGNLSNQAQGAGVATCSIYPCIRQYNASVKAGEFSENVMQQVPMLVDINYFIGNVETYPAGGMTMHVSCLDDNERANIAAIGYKFPDGVDWLAVNGLLGEFYQGAPQIFMNIFGFDVASAQPSFYASIMGGLPNEFEAPPAILTLGDYSNVTFATVSARLEGVAQSITSYMRRIPGDVPASNREPAVGSVVIIDTCVSVNWWWITLPGALCFLATFYLFLTLSLLAKKQYDAMWKSSSIPLLYHGLDRETRGGIESTSDLKKMEETARELKVQLMNHGTGWHFVGPTGSFPRTNSGGHKVT